MWRVVVDTLTFFNVRTPAVWSLDAWGLKSTLALDTIKLFFELVIEQFIGEFLEDDAVKETERLHDNLEKDINDECDLRGPLSQVTGKNGDQRSDDESQIATGLEMTDVCKEKCLD